MALLIRSMCRLTTVTLRQQRDILWKRYALLSIFQLLRISQSASCVQIYYVLSERMATLSYFVCMSRMLEHIGYAAHASALVASAGSSVARVKIDYDEIDSLPIIKWELGACVSLLG